MKIERFTPQPPPTFTMTFSRDEGWALAMALRDAFDRYPGAAERNKWKQWAHDLDKELRHGL